MQNERDPIVMRGIENVRRRYTLEQWVMLDAGNVVREIYDEIRRLDLASAQTREVNGRRLAGPRSRRPLEARVQERAAVVWAAE
jgi:hypothetical protein